MNRFLLLYSLLAGVFSIAQTPCDGGMAGAYPCSGFDLISHIPLSTFNTSGANDSWGWTDPQDGKEYVLMGLENGTAFIDISTPTSPVYLGKLPTHTSATTWRDIKVYNNYAFIVSEASNHGMQVFDLTRLRNVPSPPVTFTEDAHFNGFGSAHNLVINEETGYAYGVGTDTYGGGAHFVKIQNPLNPTNAGGWNGNYIHDGQAVIYNGPDPDYQGSEILVSSNGWDQRVTIVDVSNKSNPQVISTIFYSDPSYTHQNWFTEDQKYMILGDEIDEQDYGFNTKALIYDLTDLDNPVLNFNYYGTTPATDHNGYVKGNIYYLANYAAGFRAINIGDLANQNATEVGYFDTYPNHNNAGYSGVWNVYPYFSSGNIAINDRSGGFFLVKSSTIDTVDPVAACHNFTVSLNQNGEASISAEDIDDGSTDDSGFVTLTVSPNSFTCSDLGNVTVTLTATDPSGNTDSCTAIVTVLDALPPSFDCPPNQAVLYDTGEDFYTVPTYAVSEEDNCTSVPTVVQSPSAGTQLPQGIYTVMIDVTDDEGNTASCSFTLSVEEDLGILEKEESTFKVFPNPTQDVLRIIASETPIHTIRMLDISGKVLLHQEGPGLMEKQLDVSAFSKGMYFLQINNVQTEQIIKR